MSRNVVVTGGCGFIGSHLAAALVKLGDRVTVVDNLSTGSLDQLGALLPKMRWVEADVEDSAKMEAALRGAEIVFHQAALASVPLSVERPLDVHSACATGTLVVLDQARRMGVRRVVYAASSSLYGDRPVTANRESDLPAPLSPYAVAKLSGELYAQAFYHTYGLETVALRYFNVFGPGQDPDSPYSAVIPRFITRLLSGQRPLVFGDGHQTRDFTYVDNVVHANLLAATAAGVAGRSYNVANGRSTSLLQLLDALQRLLGTDVAPEHQAPRSGEVRHSMADISRATVELGYLPLVDFETGLARSIAYYRRLCQPAGAARTD